MPLFGRPNFAKLTEKRDVTALTKCLGHREWGVRRQAAESLGDLGDPSAAMALIALLDDDSPAVRVAVVVSLGQLGSVDGLMKALEDKDQEVRQDAAELLDQLRSAGGAAKAPAAPAAMSPDESVETLTERVTILMDSLRTSIKSGDDIVTIDRYAREAFEAIGKVLFDPRVGDDPARAEADAAFKEHQDLTRPIRNQVRLKASMQERHRARAPGATTRRKLP